MNKAAKLTEYVSSSNIAKFEPSCKVNIQVEVYYKLNIKGDKCGLGADPGFFI